MSKKYIIAGLNHLESFFLAKNKLVNHDLMKHIERRMITAVVARKQEPTQEALDREFDQQAKRFGHAAMLYRDFAAQRAELIVNKAMLDIEAKGKFLEDIQVREYEMNVHRLASENPDAKSALAEIGGTIKSVKDLLGMVDNNSSLQRHQTNRFQQFIDKSPFAEYAEEMTAAAEAAKKFESNLGDQLMESAGLSMRPSFRAFGQ